MLQLASPLVCLLLPVPVLIWLFMPHAKRHPSTAFPVPFFNALHQHFQVTASRFHLTSSFYFYALIWGLLILALAGPQWIGMPLPHMQQGRHIFLVLDISGSMDLPDMLLYQQPATRLQVVKQAAEQFVQARQTDHIGLILFGSVAYLQTPLTYDHQTILARIKDASVGLAGKTTSIGDALGLAIKKLQSTPPAGRVIILLTDGSNNSGMISPTQAALFAKTEHIKVYTIGLTTTPGQQGLVHAFLTMQAAADLDEKALKKIAHLTGGHYFRATNPASLRKIYKNIDVLETTTQTAPLDRPTQDYYPWLLGLCLLLTSGWLIFTNYRDLSWRERS